MSSQNMPSFGSANIKKPEVRRILVLKWGALGDLVAATPAIQALRRAYPQAIITVISNAPFNEIAPAGSLADELFLFKRHGEFWRILPKVRANSWDIAVNLSWNSDRSAILCYFSGAPLRAGSTGPGWLGFLYNRRVAAFAKDRHEIDRHLDIVRTLGITAEDSRPFVHISDRAVQEARDSLWAQGVKKTGLLVGIHPGASSNEKSWGVENFGWLGKEVIQRFGVDLVVTWGPGEKEMATRTALLIGEGAFTSFPTFRIEDLAALIASCKIYICNCSGPMNVALAVNTPTVALLGPTRPEEWGAYGKAHRTLTSPTRKAKAIPRNEVLSAVCELLEKQGYIPS
jgi:ADP-heptose:LPS heptosyltransferase